MAFVIDPQSASFTKIRSDLQAYINAKPDATKWNDFYASSAGTIIVELISGLGVFLQNNIIAQRRETFLAYATAPSSIRAIASNLGYSVTRGRNSEFDLTITPAFSQVLAKYDIVGNFGGTSIRVLQDTTLTVNVQSTIRCVIGELISKTLTYNSPVLQVLSFNLLNLTDEIRLKKDGIVVPHSTRILDLSNNVYTAVTNATGSVNVAYLNKDNTDPLYYSTMTALTVEGIQTDTSVVTTQNLVVDNGVLDSLSIVSVYIPPENVEQVRVNAPLFHETQSLLRSRSDYKKLILATDPTLVDSNAIDTGVSTFDITYVRSDETLLSVQQKTDLVHGLDPHRPFGVQPPTVIDPVTLNDTLTVVVRMLPGSTILAAAIQADLSSLWNSFELKLGITLDLAQMEYIAESSLAYVKTVRVSHTQLDSIAWNQYFKFAYVLTLQ